MMNGAAQLLSEGCTILGAFEELPFVKIGHLKLDKGAFLVTYTDGLSDVKNDENQYFDEHLLEDFVVKNYTQSPTEFNKMLYAHIDEFKGKQPFPDDFALLTGKFSN